MAKNTQEAADKAAEIAESAPVDTVTDELVPNVSAGTKTNVRMLSEQEINGVKIPSGRAAALNKYLAISLIEQGIADDSEAAVSYALSENPWIIDPLAKSPA